MLSEQSDTRVKLIISPRCGENGWCGARGQVELAGVLQQHARREACLDPEVRCFLCRVLALPRFVLVGKLTGTKKQPWSACGVLLSLAEAQHEVEAVVVVEEGGRALKRLQDVVHRNILAWGKLGS